MMVFGTLQALEANNDVQIQNNLLLWPIIPLHVVWLLASRYVKNSLPTAVLIGCIAFLMMLPLISGFVSGPTSSAFYLISYGFTVFTLIVSAVTHFTLRKSSMFANR